MLPISYRMNNRINGEDFVISGAGTWFEDGRMALNLALSAMPARWSGAIGPCICSGPGPGPNPNRIEGGLIGFAPNGYRTEPGTLRRATLWAESGQRIASVSATGVYEKSSSGFNFDINAETITAESTLVTELSKIDSYDFVILPNGKGKVIVISSYKLSTSNGRFATGTTYINYQFINSNNELKRRSLDATRSKFSKLALLYNGLRDKQLSRKSTWAFQKHLLDHFERNQFLEEVHKLVA